MSTAPFQASRREALRFAGGALLFPVLLPLKARAAAQEQSVGAYVRIGADETITVLVGVSEMGQGIASGLAQVVADELMVDWKVVGVETVTGTPYGNPFLRGTQGTFGSLAMRGYYAAMRKAGATVREMLKAAGAQAMNVALADVTAVNGRVVSSSTSMSYGALAALAAQQAAPADPPLLGGTRYIGRAMPRTDIPAKTTGAAVFGIDVRLPGMLYAAVQNSPVFGGTVPAGSLPTAPAGTIGVVGLDTAVAVIAKDTYSAMRAAQNLKINWQLPYGANAVSSASLLAQAQTLMTTGPAQPAETVGWSEGALLAAQKSVDLTFSLPYLAHACMEVLNCTALVTSTACTIWAPTQAQSSVVATASALTGLPAAAVTVNTTLLGGGLGRKIEQDFIGQAVRIAKTVPGTPVKLTWSREQDFGADQYRSMALVRARAGVNRDGAVAWWTRLVAPSYAFQHGGSTGVDFIAIAGATGLPYAFVSRLVEYVRHPGGVPVGSWRSIGCSINTFVAESMIDELAAATATEPLAYRRALLAGNARALAVLDGVANLSNWSTPPAAGRARGLAFCFTDNAYVAMVIEISQPASGLKVHRVCCTVDVGLAVNPDSVTAQIEGGVVHGLSATLWGEVPISGGRATIRNFNGYRMMRMKDMPQIDVTLIDGNPASLGGAGEISVPPVAPALANALKALTGQRITALPLFPAGGGSSGGGSASSRSSNRSDEKDD